MIDTVETASVSRMLGDDVMRFGLLVARLGLMFPNESNRYSLRKKNVFSSCSFQPFGEIDENYQKLPKQCK